MAHFDLILRNATVSFPWAEEKADIAVKDGRIASIDAQSSDTADKEVDLTGLNLLPGMMDSHVHFREPGKPTETVSSGTKGAALGGITTALDMPNTSPAIKSAETIKIKQDLVAKGAYVDVGIYVGATESNSADIGKLEKMDGVCGVKFFAGSSTGDLLVADEEGLTNTFKNTSRRICFHSEDEARLLERAKEYKKEGMDASNHMVWRDEECAFMCTKKIVATAEKLNRQAHILHITTQEEIDWLADHRDHASTEVLVNTLTMAAPECYERLGGRAVMNPPIRTQRHQDALWKAVQDGRVDVLSSDHAPHMLEDKMKPWPSCPSGLPGIQTSIPLMLNHVNNGKLSLSRLVDLMAAGPARIYGMVAKGRIAVGFDADFTVVDLKKEMTIKASDTASLCGWTPYDGVKVKGWPMMTIVRGNIVMREGEVAPNPKGQIAKFSV